MFVCSRAAYQGKIRALEDTIAKETGMKQAKAKNELAQLKGEDPLPLRRAKITQEAGDYSRYYYLFSL